MGVIWRTATRLGLAITVAIAICITFAPSQAFILSYGASDRGSSKQYIRVVDVSRHLDVPIITQAVATSISNWHPKQQSITYVVQQNDHHQIKQRDIATRNESVVYEGDYSVGSIAWAPDGECAAYTLGDGLYINCTDDRDDYVLHSDVQIGFIDWSPDGRFIVYSGIQLHFSSIELFLFDVNSRETASITNDSIAKFSPSFMPDSQHVVYSTFKSDIPRLIIMDTQTGAQESLPTNGIDVHNPSVSPDGRYVAFVSSDVVNGGWNIHLLDVETGNISQLTHHIGDELSPAWMPN